MNRAGGPRMHDRSGGGMGGMGMMGPAPGGGGGGPPGRLGNTYGLSVGFLESLGIDGPLNSRLFVANLSYDVDEKKMREVFRLAGRVMNVQLNKDKEGKSRGHGIIEFTHPVEAVQVKFGSELWKIALGDLDPFFEVLTRSVVLM